MIMLFLLFLIRLSLSGRCGWVDVGKNTLRLGTCYVQCQEVTEECWDQKFDCDTDGNLVLESFRDAEINCGGHSIGKQTVCKRDEAGSCATTSIVEYSCEGDTSDGAQNTCTSFHYIDNVHNVQTPDNHGCGFLQVDVRLVAKTCFADESGGFYKQNCDNEFTVSACTDPGCTNCVTQTKNLFGLEGDHCMSGSCIDETNGEVINSVFLPGTPRSWPDLYLGVWNPARWSALMWVCSFILIALVINAVFQFRFYRFAKKGNSGYNIVKSVDSDSEMQKLQ